MTGFRGRALIYPGLLIAGWIVGRSISLSATPAAPMVGKVQSADARFAASIQTLACPMPAFPAPTESTLRYLAARPVVYLNRIQRHNPPRYFGGHESPPIGFASASFSLGAEAGPFRLDTLSSAPQVQSNGTAKIAPVKQRRLQLYGYNFWRQGSAGAALAPQAQYGGSQFGAIATWDPLGSAGRGPALLVRASGTPDGLQQEVAVGARWQPDRKWPVSLSVERRFRFYGKDGFAAHVAGGADAVPLVGKLTLDAYGQAGYSLGGISSPFVDAHARVQHPLAKPLGIPIRIGAGAWIGGQKGAYRGDFGPTLSAQIDNRFADFTLQLDWRKRVVGNAAPVDGLALTVATDF